MPTRRPTRPATRHGRCRRRRRARVLVASVVVTAIGGAASASTAQSGSPAATALADAQQARVAAERRLAELTKELATLDAEVERRFAGAAELAAALESARSQMRASAIAAYVDGGLDDVSLALFSDEDLGDASGRRTFATSRALDFADAAADFRALQQDNDPELIDAVSRREALASRVADAQDALFQANAVEADAERASVAEAAQQAEAARAEAAAAAAARRAEQQAAKAGAPATTKAPKTSKAPKTTATTVPRTPPAPPTELVLLTEPSAPLPDLPPGGPTEEQWAEMRDCESSGNYRAVSKSGRYRGAYQFDQQTWESVGGLGDPAAALPIEQDARAKLLFAERGVRAWPHCGLALL